MSAYLKLEEIVWFFSGRSTFMAYPLIQFKMFHNKQFPYLLAITVSVLRSIKVTQSPPCFHSFSHSLLHDWNSCIFFLQADAQMLYARISNTDLKCGQTFQVLKTDGRFVKISLSTWHKYISVFFRVILFLIFFSLRPSIYGSEWTARIERKG